MCTAGRVQQRLHQTGGAGVALAATDLDLTGSTVTTHQASGGRHDHSGMAWKPERFSEPELLLLLLLDLAAARPFNK